MKSGRPDKIEGEVTKSETADPRDEDKRRRVNANPKGAEEETETTGKFQQKTGQIKRDVTRD